MSSSFLMRATLALAFVFTTSVTTQAMACRCAEPNFAQLREQSSAIFEGRAVSETGAEVEFAVTQFWQGNVGEHVVVHVPETTSCSPNFVIGEHYIVFVDANQMTHACSSFAATDFAGRATLGAGEIPFEVEEEVSEHEAATVHPHRHHTHATEDVHLATPHPSQAGCGSCRTLASSHNTSLPAIAIMTFALALISNWRGKARPQVNHRASSTKR